MRLSLGLVATLAVVTVVVYLTGEPAEEAVEGLTGVSEGTIELHEEAALMATLAVASIGLLSLAELIYFRRGLIPRRLAVGTLWLTLVPLAAVAWAANLGGQIRHTEIRSELAASAVGAGSAAPAEGRVNAPPPGVALKR